MKRCAVKQVQTLDQGSVLVAKQMNADEGSAFPGHTASKESVLTATEGRCVVKFVDSERVLEVGEAIVIPADVWHQVVADPAFKAAHVMPKGIEFTFTE